MHKSNRQNNLGQCLSKRQMKSKQKINLSSYVTRTLHLPRVLVSDTRHSDMVAYVWTLAHLFWAKTYKTYKLLPSLKFRTRIYMGNFQPSPITKQNFSRFTVLKARKELQINIHKTCAYEINWIFRKWMTKILHTYQSLPSSFIASVREASALHHVSRSPRYFSGLCNKEQKSFKTHCKLV